MLEVSFNHGNSMGDRFATSAAIAVCSSLLKIDVCPIVIEIRDLPEASPEVDSSTQKMEVNLQL